MQNPSNLRVIFFLVFAISLFGLFFYPSSTQVTAESISYVKTNFDYAESTLGTTAPLSKTNLYSGSISADIRAVVFDEYFKRHNSPLLGYGQIFVDACTEYEAPKDCTIVVAIARNESRLCTYSISAQMHNCWGFGGGGTNRRSYDSFNDAIFKVTNVLAYQYGYEYMIDPRKMERTFCGPDAECTGWGSSILFFMEEINNLSIELGYGSLYDLR